MRQGARRAQLRQAGGTTMLSDILFPWRLSLALAAAAALTMVAAPAAAQRTIPLYPGVAPGAADWTRPETALPMPDGGTLYQNVTRPDLTVYLPPAASATGAGVILLPGGGLRVLAIGGEAKALIERLNQAGIAVFVLRYRTLQMQPITPGAASGKMPARFPSMVIRHANANPSPDDARLTAVFDAAVADAQRALAMVRERAARYHLDPHRLGMLGSSAGGGVAIGAYLKRDGEGPDFLISLYGPSLMDVAVPADAPPLFMATEADHGPVTQGLIDLFELWKARGRSAELHVFGVPNGQMAPSLYLDRLLAWMRSHKIIAAEQKAGG